MGATPAAENRCSGGGRGARWVSAAARRSGRASYRRPPVPAHILCQRAEAGGARRPNRPTAPPSSRHTSGSRRSGPSHRARRSVREVGRSPRYRQLWRTPGSELVERVLRSEFVLVGTTDRAEWVGFRDVFVVDGRRVHDRQDRLRQLFLQRNPRVLERARVIADESARYNLGEIHRNFNVPTAALFFLPAPSSGLP